MQRMCCVLVDLLRAHPTTGNDDRFGWGHVGRNLFWSTQANRFIYIDQGKALGWLVRALMDREGSARDDASLSRAGREGDLHRLVVMRRQELMLPAEAPKRNALLQSVNRRAGGFSTLKSMRNPSSYAALFGANESCYFTHAFRLHLHVLMSSFARVLGSRAPPALSAVRVLIWPAPCAPSPQSP